MLLLLLWVYVSVFVSSASFSGVMSTLDRVSCFKIAALGNLASDVFFVTQPTDLTYRSDVLVAETHRRTFL